jgi:acyl homoserine lactone synthase
MQLSTLTLTRHAFGRHVDLVVGMHRLRGRVFKDRLDWDVTVSGDMEIDSYDAEDATYLLVVADGREVVGHVRLLPTLGPNMLADTFPFLMDDGEAPCSPGIVESSRFCVDTSRVTDVTGNGTRRATNLLFASILEWCLAHGQHTLATVTDTRMERILRRSGWPLQRLGAPRRIGTTDAVAGLLPITSERLRAFREASREPVRPAAVEGSLKLAA